METAAGVGAASGSGVIDQLLKFGAKELGKAAIGDLLSTDTPASTASTAPKSPFAFFGGMPFRSASSTGAAPRLTRLSSGQNVFGADGQLQSPGFLGQQMRRG